jgi:hypothetical protein
MRAAKKGRHPIPAMTRRQTLIAPLLQVKANNTQTMVEANNKPVRTKKQTKWTLMRR